DGTRLVSESRRIAERLYAVQDSRNSEGILVVARGQIDAGPCVGILKLEHEKGVQAQEEQDHAGHRVFKVVLHEDLVLTQTTRVFKGALFRLATADGGDGGSLEGLASDLQTEGDVAGFFLGAFLGSKLVDIPSVATEKYF